MNKASSDIPVTAPTLPSDGDMELINRFTRKRLSADEVYTFEVILCDNEIDRDLERFDTDALRALADMFVGKTGIFDHSMSGIDQTSRLYSAELVIDAQRENSLGEPYAFIKAKAYMPRCEKNLPLIEEIDAGIKKEVSVSCSVGEVVCSQCGADLRLGGCGHVKGRVYGDVICHAVLRKPSDAYEWSFVAVPAQPAAGVTKAFAGKKEVKFVDNIIKAVKGESDGLSLTASELKSLQCAIASLESKAADGEAYRTALLSETVRLGVVALPSMCADSLEKMCGKLSTQELCELKKAFSSGASDLVPQPQLSPARVNSDAPDISEFRI